MRQPRRRCRNCQQVVETGAGCWLISVVELGSRRSVMLRRGIGVLRPFLGRRVVRGRVERLEEEEERVVEMREVGWLVRLRARWRRGRVRLAIVVSTT